MVKKVNYSVLIGHMKSVKNTLITYGLPVILVILNHANEWLPDEYAVSAAPFIGYVCYFIKNYVENK